MNFCHQHVLITGATGGIGQAIARSFHQAGATVALCGRKKSVLESLLEEFKERCSIWSVDLANREEVKSLIPSVEQRHGPLQVVINNSGATQDQLAIRMKENQWDEILNLNLTSTFFLCQEALKSMMKQRWGRIINIASIVAMTGNMGQANYVASKAGLLGMTKTLAQEVARWHITVNAIAPGFIETPMTEGLPEEHRHRLLSNIPCQTFGKPEDIAHGALFLADPKSHYITGQTLHINGGMGMF